MPLHRSPYSLRTTQSLPERLPPGTPSWVFRLRAWIGSKVAPEIPVNKDAYISERNTGQIIRGSSDYQTGLQANWSGGLRSNPVTPASVPSTLAARSLPWPEQTAYGQAPNPTGGQGLAPRDTPIGRAINRPPLPAPYRQTHSQTGQHSPALISISGGQPKFSVDFQPPPWRVPLVRRSGVSLMAGPRQFSTQQHSAGMTCNVVAGPPVWSNPTRGARSVSGIMGRVQSPGRSWVPAVYVPREVR